MKSTVLIIPAPMQAAGNSVAEAMGWGPNNYSVALFTGEALTHYGMHTYSSLQFEAWLTGQEPLPEGMGTAQSVIDALIYSFRDNIWDAEHFAQVLVSIGLTMEPEETRHTAA